MDFNEQNKLMSKIEREAWIRESDSCQRPGVLGDWMKEGEGINKNHIYITPGDRQQCGDGGKGALGIGGGGQRREKWG